MSSRNYYTDEQEDLTSTYLLDSGGHKIGLGLELEEDDDKTSTTEVQEKTEEKTKKES